MNNAIKVIQKRNYQIKNNIVFSVPWILALDKKIYDEAVVENPYRAVERAF